MLNIKNGSALVLFLFVLKRVLLIEISFKSTNLSPVQIPIDINNEIFNVSIDISSPINKFYNFSELYKKDNIENKTILFSFANSKEINIGLKLLWLKIPKPLKDKNKKLGKFGLGRKVNEKYSLIHYLYNNKITKFKAFSIIFSYPNWGTITLGEATNEFLTKYQESCQVIKSPILKKYYNYWGCNLYGIFFGEYLEQKEGSTLYTIDEQKSRAVQIKAEVYFSTTQNIISIPCIVFEYLKQFYFLNNCIEVSQGNLTLMKCSKDEIEDLEIIHFVFDENLDLLIHSKSLYNKETKEFNIGCYKNDTSNAFVFGRYFLKNWNTRFDYENDTIYFAGLLGKLRTKPINYLQEINIEQKSSDNDEYITEEDEIEYSVFDMKNLKDLMIYTVFIICIIGCFFIIYIYKKLLL